MNDAIKKFGEELAIEIKAWAESAEVKQAIEETKAADKSGTFEVAITSEHLDRYQEVIKIDGWELEHYRANPVVLWGHDHHQLPIGVATELTVKDGKMIAKGKFASHPFAQEVRRLYDMGMMRATSVGFIEKEREGNIITKAELLEFSFVSVPANPHALSTLVKHGASINEMVTKGFVFVEKDAEEPAPEPEPTPEPEPVSEEKVFDATDLKEVTLVLKNVLVALEALTEKEEEPERDDEPEESEEEKALKQFNESRRQIQVAATVLGDVLADMRREMEARR